MSVSAHSSIGKASETSGVRSLSSSVSALSPVPSASLSAHSLTSSGNTSASFAYVSPSRSESSASQVKSASISAGVLVASSGRDEDAYAPPSSQLVVSSKSE